MTDLRTTYLGLSLKNPIVPSASPLSRTLDSVKRLEDAGAAAIVMYSLFEEQINQQQHQADYYQRFGTDSLVQALNYYPDWDRHNVGPDEYLDMVSLIKRSVGVPVIASLNGASHGGWTRYARLIEGAGADALELNLYYIPVDTALSSAQIEQAYLDVLRDVKNSIGIPVAVKIGPYFSAMPSMAQRFAEAGAGALVLFNRFYQPDFDLEKREVTPNLVFSRSEDLRLPLNWVSLLYGRIPVDFAITSGVHTHEDVLKAVMAGASVAMMASELLENGIDRIATILQEMTQWMEAHACESVTALQGILSRHQSSVGPAPERADYRNVLDSVTTE